MATSPSEGVAVQTVKLKVLYTFDAEQRDNHLARWPHSTDVQTCSLDNSSHIGVIDLRTCLQAVTTASPELLTKLDGDYAVYAYDYSEEDTPLVGQGMLSRALDTQEGTIEAESEAMITGRITKGVMGLFSKNAQPTLEVKLRLTPVATFSQQRMRSGSISSQDGRQPQWSSTENLLPQNLQRSASPMDTTGLENMQRMLSEGGPPRDRTGSYAADAYNNFNPPRPASRPGTPTLVQGFNQSQRQPAGSSSRSESQSGMRQGSHGRRDSFNSGYYSGEENLDDGPSRKRAKITKVDWPTKSNFNIERQPDSLRVVASTASSVRLHRPIAISPATALQTGVSAEEPVRPPTPISLGRTGRGRDRAKRVASSNLIHGARARDSSPAGNSLHQPEATEHSFSSPEDMRARSVSSTPANIPSSPPVMLDQPPMITSPALPPMLANHDSGFMSGSLEDLFGDDPIMHFDDFILDKAHEEQNMVDFDPSGLHPLEKQYAPVFEEGNDIEPLPSRLPPPPKQTPLLPPPRPMSRAQSFTPGNRVSISSPRLAPAPIPRARQILEEQREQRAKALLTQVPASDPVGRTLHRANTWAPDMSDALTSEAPEGEESKSKNRKRVGKDQTRARLESAIAAGEMPPYCDNCGAIETPAWRRGYIKTFTCKWEEVETSLDHGACVYKEPLERNDDGSIKTFKGYKVEKKSGDENEGWVQICLCNPCGLWFHKQKCPRPKEKWQKKEPKDKKKRKRPPKAPKGPKKGAKSDAYTPASEDSSPADTATEAPDGDDNENDMNTGEDENTDSNEPQLPQMPHNMRASSAEPIVRGLKHRYQHSGPQREVQSSPGKPHGSEGEPIELDLTPKPLRRQLFPSPDKVQVRVDSFPAGAARTATGHLPAFVRRSPRLNKTVNLFSLPGVGGTVALTADGKENVIPTVTFDDGLDTLFEASMQDVNMPPSTPTSKRRSERLLLKTPQRQFGLDMSPNARQSPSFRTPLPKQSQHPIVAALLGTAKKDITEMTPFSRSIHEALSDAPEFGIVTPAQVTRTSGGGRNSKKATPRSKGGIDFPDLPSLKNSSPLTGGSLFNFDFSELPTDPLHTDMNDPFSTDGAMTNSSPPNFFSFINTDDDDDDEPVTLWGNMSLPEHGLGTTTESVYPEPDGMEIGPAPSQVLRRSPRKAVS